MKINSIIIEIKKKNKDNLVIFFLYKWFTYPENLCWFFFLFKNNIVCKISISFIYLRSFVWFLLFNLVFCSRHRHTDVFLLLQIYHFLKLIVVVIKQNKFCCCRCCCCCFCFCYTLQPFSMLSQINVRNIMNIRIHNTHICIYIEREREWLQQFDSITHSNWISDSKREKKTMWMKELMST